MQRLFLTGLSGSGKTTIGRMLAQALGWDFVDTDDLLAEHCGALVGQALVQYGEQRFREMESDALRTAAWQECVVIATGGGAVISAANRAFMREQGLTIYLRATVETAWARIQEQTLQDGTMALRPLVTGANGQEKLRELYHARRQWYEEARVHIDADSALPGMILNQIISAALVYGCFTAGHASREALTLQLGAYSSSLSSSPAIVAWGGLNRLPQHLQEAGFHRRVFIVTDAVVGQLYAAPVQAILAEAGMEPHTFTVPAGEASKSFQWFERVIDWLVEQGAEHQEPLIALGGGVVGDLTGFVAASYQRGVPLIQVPTTLLAQVDSAIGGKTGINHARGKNLVGAFYQPRLILVDPAALLTLPERAYREGWGEIVKYGMILDADLFHLLEMHAPALLARDPRSSELITRIIARCIQLKMDVVQRDERDSGLRNILNYGHTFAHALEALSGYDSWLHGEAVAIGMEVAARIAVARGLLSSEDAQRQQSLSRALGLPVQCPRVDIDAALAIMQRDKKVRNGRTRWVLPSHVGHVEVYNDVEVRMVRDAIAAVCNL